MSEKKQYIKVELFTCGQSMGSYLCDPLHAFAGVYLIGLDEGDSYKFSCVMMTEEEVDALPEFTGF